MNVILHQHRRKLTWIRKLNELVSVAWESINKKWTKEYTEISAYKNRIPHNIVAVSDNRPVERTFGQAFEHLKLLDDEEKAEALIWEGMRQRENEREEDIEAERMKALAILENSS
ncbi:Oidioi.mRNA.OKI2018_I69.chr2.g7038.t1.cds [Oikopleura dioica]|uniref:Oidioi.mRNA.OKI2018_I69.PAR.g8771.t1.cds n=1 Tax=Oikopleura dioica TaxID=34765 RepID=A0ABN7RKW0_OIKDI|nr:Oidioi.mRNA.OKI2018_I69.PAR.g8771.t1.cds [Oikopleura dioica]CAG5112871.1 Oidioi.mRNA.OKI2018_I69.chr2.g7038.t1.cds [Oikopleura dioica]